MMTALLRNEADTATITVSTALGQIKEGNVRALAGTSMRQSCSCRTRRLLGRRYAVSMSPFGMKSPGQPAWMPRSSPALVLPEPLEPIQCQGRERALVAREGLLRAGQYFSWSWTRGGDLAGSIGVRPEWNAVVYKHLLRAHIRI